MSETLETQHNGRPPGEALSEDELALAFDTVAGSLQKQLAAIALVTHMSDAQSYATIRDRLLSKNTGLEITNKDALSWACNSLCNAGFASKSDKGLYKMRDSGLTVAAVSTLLIRIQDANPLLTVTLPFRPGREGVRTASLRLRILQSLPEDDYVPVSSIAGNSRWLHKLIAQMAETPVVDQVAASDLSTRVMEPATNKYSRSTYSKPEIQATWDAADKLAALGLVRFTASQLLEQLTEIYPQIDRTAAWAAITKLQPAFLIRHDPPALSGQVRVVVRLNRHYAAMLKQVRDGLAEIRAGMPKENIILAARNIINDPELMADLLEASGLCD